MPQVEFGIGLRRVDDIAASAREAERLGYQFVSTGEHVFFHGPVNNGLIALAAAAGATSSIKLMSAITLVPHFSRLVDRYALAGNPDDCIARLREYIDAGARTIMLNSACPSDYIVDNERLLAESVLPAFSG